MKPTLVTFRELVDREYQPRGFNTKQRWKSKIHLETDLGFSTLDNAYEGRLVNGDTINELDKWAKEFWPKYTLDRVALTKGEKRKKRGGDARKVG